MVPLLRIALAVGLITVLSPVREPWGTPALPSLAGAARGPLLEGVAGSLKGSLGAADQAGLARVAEALGGVDRERLGRVAAALAGADGPGLARAAADLSEADRAALRRAWDGLSPEARSALARRLAAAAGLPPRTP